MVMEGSSERNMINPPEINVAVVESDVADKEDENCRMVQKVSKGLSKGVGSYAEDVLGTCMVETEEILRVSNSVGGDAGLILGNVSNSWVIDSCLGFYPKVGVTCEGEENNMKRLIKDMEDARQQISVEGEGISNSARVSKQIRELKKLDNYVNYDRGRSEVQLGKGRGRGRKGVL